MSEAVSVESDGPEVARSGLERAVGEGRVAVFPADGLYGLACDPLNAEAIDRIQGLKGREKGKPSAVMYFSPKPMRGLIEGFTPLVQAAVSTLLPGPATLVVDNPERHYPLACGDSPDRLGIRLIAGALEGVTTPVFQTSANRSGEPGPARLDRVPDQIRSRVDLEIDGGELTGQPSTVIDLTEIDGGGPWKVLREGGLPYAEVERRLTGLALG